MHSYELPDVISSVNAIRNEFRHSPASANLTALIDDWLIRVSTTKLRDRSRAPMAAVASSRRMVVA
jgi:hypothetical protein